MNQRKKSRKQILELGNKSYRKIGSLDTVLNPHFTISSFQDTPKNRQSNQNLNDKRQIESQFKFPRKQFLGDEKEQSVNESSSCSQNTFIVPVNNKENDQDKRDELISDLFRNSNISGNLLRYRSLNRTKFQKTMPNTTRNNYILPKRNPFANSKLLNPPRSFITYNLPLVKQVECLKAKSTPLSSYYFLSKIKTVSDEFKRRTTDNFTSINKKIVEFNRRRIIDIYKTDLRRSSSMISTETFSPNSKNDPTVRLKENWRNEAKFKDADSYTFSEKAIEQNPTNAIKISAKSSLQKSSNYLEPPQDKPSVLKKRLSTDKDIPCVTELEEINEGKEFKIDDDDPFDLDEELLGNNEQLNKNVQIIDKKNRSKSAYPDTLKSQLSILNKQHLLPSISFGKIERRDSNNSLKSGDSNLFRRGIESLRLKQHKHSTIYEKSQKGSVQGDSDKGETKLNQYKLLQTIGKGSYSIIRLAQDERNDKYYAIKIIDVQRMKRTQMSKLTTGVDSIENEIDILKSIKNEYCLGAHEVIGDEEDDKIYIIMDYMKNDSLISYIKANKLTEELIWKLFRQLIDGLEYLHSNDIIHRDIKPENLLVDDNENLKITDFGLSEKLKNKDNDISNTAGTNYYYCPESLQGKPFNGKKADIWACGITLYQMINGAYPFNGKTMIELNKEICEKQPDYKESLSSTTIQLLNGMLNKNPLQRLTLREIKNCLTSIQSR